MATNSGELSFSGELTYDQRTLLVDVPENVSSFSLTGTTCQKGFIYAFIYDAEQRLRGSVLLVKPEKTLAMSKDEATLGAIKGELPAGQWMVKLYNLEGESRTPRASLYRLDIRFNEKVESLALETTPSLTADNQVLFDYSEIKKPASAWYKGDLHAHTRLSDGNNSLAAAVAIVESQGLDFFFLTEHNICHPQLPVSPSCLFIPGIEITTSKGHFNVHGPSRGLEMVNADCSSEAIIEQGLSIVDNEQGSISVNHPMMKPWHWHYDAMPLVKVNTLEVCCDPTWSTSPQSTEDALDVLSAMWNAGHRIAAVGGSDSHLEPHERNPKATLPSIYGDPATFVYSHGLSGEGILAGLRNGQVYIERQCGLQFSINQGDILPGQDVGDAIVSYHLSVADTSNGYYAECVADGVVIASYPITRQGIEFEVDMSQHSWLRVDIRRGEPAQQAGDEQDNAVKGEFEGVINPVYNGLYDVFTNPTLSTWGELIENMKHNGN